MAAVDYFLKIDGVPGESLDAKHKDEIQVLAFNWEEVRPGDLTSNLPSGKIQMKPFALTMPINKASPKLFLMCAQGTVSPKMIFAARKAGLGQQDYLRITLHQAWVTEFELQSPEDTDKLPTGKMELSFSEMEVEYLPQKADGVLGGPIKGRFNLNEMQAK